MDGRNTTERRKALQDLYDRGAHLFRFNVERSPRNPHEKTYHLPERWQSKRDPVEDVLDAEHVGLVVGSLGLTVPDVDVKEARSLQDRTLLGQAKVERVLVEAGHTPLVTYTPSRGAHCFYRRPYRHGKRHVQISGIEEKVEVFGSTGFVELYDPVALAAKLDHLPVFDGPSLKDDEDAPKTNGALRGRKVGDRNKGAFIRARCAAENDADPGPAIEQAVQDAIDAGLSQAEARKAAGQGTKYGREKRTYEKMKREAEFEPPEPAGPPDPILLLVPAPEPRGGQHHKFPMDARMLAEDLVATTDFTERYKRIPEDKMWLHWIEGTGWVRDYDSAKVLAEASRFGRDRFYSEDKKQGGLRSDKAAGGRVSLARETVAVLPGLGGVSVSSKRLDAHPSLLGLPGGRCYDLDRDEIRDQEPGDMVLRSVPFDPAPVEGSAIEAIMAHMFPVPEIRVHLLALLGQALWGVPRTRAIVMLQGRSGTGKTTLERLLALALGPYATTMKSDTLTTKATTAIGWEVESANAMLRGIRLAVMSELPRRRKLDPARINELTGGDDLVSRKKQGDPIRTAASHTIVFAVNDLPRIDVVNAPETALALFQRLRPYPLTKPLGTVLGPLGQKAMADPREIGAVLQMLMDGARYFRQHGEGCIPGAMKTTLEDYWSDLVWDENP